MPRTARGCSKIRRCSLSFFCGLHHASRWGCNPAHYPLRKPLAASLQALPGAPHGGYNGQCLGLRWRASGARDTLVLFPLPRRPPRRPRKEGKHPAEKRPGLP